MRIERTPGGPAQAAPSRDVARRPVAVLGATGAVGQTFIRRLARHPWFEIAELAASERSAGRRFADACRWIEGTMPEEVAELEVRLCDPGDVRSRLVFSALDSGVAGAVEQAFAGAGAMVLSNARNHRMDVDVPLVIPEINAPHLGLLESQRRCRGWPGGIVTNANCAATVAAMALAPLHQHFGVRRVMVFTMQAVSGAGYPGVPSLDILGNVIPFIADEESKIEREIGKMLGVLEGDTVRAAPMTVSAHANRVPTEHGHLVCLSVALEERATPEAAMTALREWRGHPDARDLPSAPPLPLIVTAEADRPQTRRDVDAGHGMAVTVGRVRADPLFDLRLVALGHNTIRGAAGGSVLNAELLAFRGLLEPA
jgi:aspartate-semialdehyde dehydrogenase